MSRFRHWLRYPLRYRSSRGFGIHSPFAFRFVREVLCERLPYYVYDEVDDDGMRLIFRIACYFNPKQVLVLGGDKATMAHLLTRFDSRIGISYSLRSYAAEKAFIIVDDETVSEQDVEQIQRSAAADGVVIVRHFSHNNTLSDSLYRHMIDATDHGMGFSNGLTGVFVGLRYLPKQEYQLCFRS